MKILTKMFAAPATHFNQERQERATSLNPQAMETKRFQKMTHHKVSLTFAGKDDPVFRLDRIFGDFLELLNPTDPLKQDIENHIAAKVSLNRPEANSGETFLHQATRSGRLDLVHLLIDNGANVEATSKTGETAFHMAIQAGRLDIAKVLKEKGAPLDFLNPTGEVLSQIENAEKTPLIHWVAENGSPETLKFLLQLGASIILKNSKGETPLIRAVQLQRYENVELLLKKINESALQKDILAGISVQDYLDHRDQVGMSALHWAAMQPKDTCAQLLVSQGASLNIKNSRGKTPLHWAVALGNQEVIQLLAWKGAQLDIADDEGITPRALANQSSKPGVLNALTGGYR